MPHCLRNTLFRLAVAAAAATTLPVVSVMADEHAHATTPAAADVKHSDVAASVSADDAIKMLADGNARFVAGTPSGAHLDQSRLCETFANGQHPYAAVLSCADSRVAVDHVLDAGIGDLFVVRVAGNVADVDEIGTLEYGVENLGINAILVLGHTKCDAVTAVVNDARLAKNIEKLVDNIVPAVQDARKAFPQLSGPRLVTQAVRLNVRRSMADLFAKSDVIRQRVKDGRLKIVGGVYDLHTGDIDWLEQSTSTLTAVTSPAAAAVGSSTPANDPSSHTPATHGDSNDDDSEPAEHSKPLASGRSSSSSSHADSSAKSESRQIEHAERVEHAEHAIREEKSDHAPHASSSHAEKPANERDEADDHKLDDAGHAKAAPAAPAAEVAGAVAKTPERKENLLLLGGMLAASSVISFGMIQLFGSRQRAAGTAPAESITAPAAIAPPVAPAAAHH